MMTREEAIKKLQKQKAEYLDEWVDFSGVADAYDMAIEALSKWIPAVYADRPNGEWIQKPHKVYLPRDYEPDIIDYHNHQYNEEDHSIVEYWWYCNQCDYEADRWSKPTSNFCPNCGAKMKGGGSE